MFKYTRLFDILNHRGMKKTDLLDVISSKTLAKLSKDEPISGEIIEKICSRLKCQPSDIMYYIEEGGITEIEGEKKDIVYIYEIDYNSPDFKSKENIGLVDENGDIDWL